MIRKIICTVCAESSHPLEAEDRAQGWHLRQRRLLVKRPKNHGYTIRPDKSEVYTPLDKIHCDTCDVEIPDGNQVVAITQWRRPEVPGDWEKQYGHLV